MSDQGAGVAIIGMAGRFPGAADIDAFWNNLAAGRESITFFTPDQLSVLVPAALRSHPRYVAARGVLDDADRFDADFFNVSEREALLMDPQQRIFLELCWNALEHAAVDPQRYAAAGKSIGVYAGVSNNGYRKLVDARPDLIAQSGEFAAMLANEKDYVATRVAHRIGLTGPAISLYTACSTSLVAIAQAWYALMSWQCDVALAGGINIVVPQESGHVPVEGGMESADGHCRSFDASADGTLFSSGGAVVVLKRLADAIADGDTIWGVLRGVGVNNDGGDKASFTSPSVRGQAEAIRLALAAADVSADSISYVEAHGTATQLGDPIEVEALRRAFVAEGGESTSADPWCWLGSVKSNFGHLVAASGVTGLIKTVLALQHEMIPPTLHFERANPEIDFAATPFKVADHAIAWPRGAQPRRAGVSSFGVGGTNAHVIVEEAPALPARAPPNTPAVLVISARDAAALQRRIAQLREVLIAQPELSLADLGWTLATGRRAMRMRAALVATTPAQALAQLETVAAQAFAQRPHLVFAFPGQGAQHANMARGLFETEPVFRAALERCCALASTHLDLDLRDLILPAAGAEAAADERLAQTRYTQPALFAIQYALASLWQSLGVQPDAMIGHSIGEYVAACVAGVFTLDDAIKLVVARAAAMHAQPPGAMLAVRLGESDLRARLQPGVEIAAVNAARLCVVAGRIDTIEAFATELATAQIACTRLRVSHAFHSSLMEGAVAIFRQAFDQVSLHAPTLPFYSCVSGELIRADEATSIDYWCSQLRAPVRFADAAARAFADPAALALEVGPGQSLTGLLRSLAASPARAVASLGAPGVGDDASQFRVALGKLWCAGVEPDWVVVFAAAQRRRVALPGYPFAGRRYWIDVPDSAAIAPVLQGAAELLPDRSSIKVAGAVVSAADPVPPAEHGDRAVRLRAQLRELFESLSGEPIEPAHDDVAFLELGMDSLALTQATLELEKRFGLKIKFRRLMEDLDSVAKLGAWIEPNLPAEKIQSSPLRALAVGTDDVAPADLRERPFGAAARITTRRNLDLSPAQQAWIDDFTRRYTARTAKSKAFTQQHRELMADPRAVTGFNPLWKELVYPIVADRSLGARLWDLDNNEYIDLLNGFGANFLGYQPEYISTALKQQIDAGFEIGPQHPLTAEVAGLISEMTGMPRVAFCNTGSEAVMGAMRIARTVTGRDTIVIFTNSYHGIFDEVIVRGTRRLRSIAAAPGILANAVENVLVLEYGSDESLQIIRDRAHQLAAVMIEPVQGRNPSLQPREFVQALRSICDAAACALIFDEVITGFRIATGGAQEFYGVRADIATYGKIIGGGLPFAAIAGSSRWMDALDGGNWRFGDDSYPEAGVTYFAGTFVRHPLALAAAKAALMYLKTRGPGLQREITARTARLIDRLNAMFVARGAPIHAAGFSSLWRMFVDTDQACADLLYFALRERGLHVYAQFNCFLTDAHGEAEVEAIASRVDAVVAELIAAGVLSSQVAAQNSLPPSAQPSSSLARQATDSPVSLRPTDAQLEKWLACQFGDTANTAFNESLLLTLHGDLDRAALEQAVATVTQRHEAFATSFDASGEMLRIGPRRALAMPFVDMAGDGDQGSVRLRAHCTASMRAPFDLTVGPLLRVELIRLAPQTHALFVVAHHLIFDGWSAVVFLQELATAYRAFATGSVPQLAPAESLATFVRTEQERRDRPEAKAQLDYWMGVHAQVPPALNLPNDRGADAAADFLADTAHHEFSVATSLALQKLAARSGVTLYGALLAGFVSLLARLSAQREFVIGIPFAAQALAGSGELIGDGVNTLPLRVAIDDGDTFDTLARRCHRQLLDAADNQDVTLYTLARALSPQQRRNNAMLTEVIFNLNPRVPALNFGGLQYELRDSAKVASVWQLFFNLNQTEQGITLGLHYSTARFDAATIARWIGHYESLLVAAAADDAPIAALPMLSPTELESLGRGWKNTERRFDRGLAVSDVIADRAQRVAARVAVESAGSRLSYAELIGRARQFARGLVQRGIGRGDLIGLCVPRGVDMLTATLGVWFSGAAYVPLDPLFPSPRLLGMVEAARIRHVVAVTSEDPPAAVAERCDVLLLADLIASASVTQTLPNVQGDDLAYVLFTSGSTGQPKGVRVRHRNLHNFLLGMQDMLKLDEKDVLCAVTTLSFDIAGLELYLPLIAGARVCIASDGEHRDPHALLGLVKRCGATVLQTTPSLLRVLITAEHGKELQNLRLLIGGEELARDLAELSLSRCRELWNLYGPTETTVWSVATRIYAGTDAVALGRPIANTRVYVLDAHRGLVAPGVSGEIWIAGEGVADGYISDAVQTAARFQPDPFVADGSQMYRTGDLGSLRNGVLYFHGRADHQIKLRGFRIEPGEIEVLARTEAGVRDAVAVALDLGADDKRLVLYVAAPGSSHDLIARLRDRLRHGLPTYMLPQHIEVLDRLPQTANGKIDRKALPLPLAMQVQPPQSGTDEPRNAMERTVATFWRELLRVNRVGIHDNFFELGGDSLLGVHLFHRVQSVFGINLPLATLFTAQTIAEQAREFSAAGAHDPQTKANPKLPVAVAADRWSLLVPIQPLGERPPFICVHSMGGNVLNYLPLARALGNEQPFFGVQALGLDGLTRPLQSLQDMAAHYRREIRARFPQGPYYLGGGSMGGMIAFELAQQLIADGEEVALLAMFDTYGPANRFYEIQHAGSLERMQFRWRDRWARARQLDAAGRWRMIADAFNRRVQRGSDIMQRRWHRWRGDALPHDVRYRELEDINLRAYYDYNPEPYTRPITLFRATEQPEQVAQSRTLGWDGIAIGGLHVIDLPGTHDSLIEQPLLTDMLRDALDRAQRVAAQHGEAYRRASG